MALNTKAQKDKRAKWNALLQIMPFYERTELGWHK